MSKERLTYVVLGVFLILSGLTAFISGLGGIGILIPILALAAGVLILVSSPGISYSVGWVVTAIYLIIRGFAGIIDFSFSGMGTVMAIFALGGGILLLIRFPGFKHHIGFTLFCAWLILVGLGGLVSIDPLGTIIAIVAIASGILMILNE